MRWRRFAMCCVMVIGLTGCSHQLGRDVPECGSGVTNSIIMEIQAVASASWVPCINALEVGWEYHHLEPRSGLAEFSIGSDRIGEQFLTVRTTDGCDLSRAQPVVSDEPGIELYKNATGDFVVEIVVIAEGDTDETLAAARSLAADLFGTRLGDRPVEVVIDRTEGITADRIRSAHATGAHVMAISIRGAEEGTVSLLLADGVEEAEGSIGHAVEAIEDATEPPSYRGSWYYVFDGGCTEYRFDARGPGVETVAGDVQQSLSFTDAEAVKELARRAGYDLP